MSGAVASVECPHKLITSTEAKGWHCADCGVRLLSLSMPIPMPQIERAIDILFGAPILPDLPTSTQEGV